MTAVDLLEMDAVAALLELRGARTFNDDNQASPSVKLSVDVPAVPDATATPTPKSPQHTKAPVPNSPEIVQLSYGLIVRKNPNSQSPTTPKHRNVESSKQKLNLYEEHLKDRKMTVKKKKAKKSMNVKKTQDEVENDPQIKMMEARVKSLMTEMHDLQSKLEKYQHIVPLNESNTNSPNYSVHPTSNNVVVKRRVSEDSDDDDDDEYTPVVKRSNVASANWNKPPIHGANYCKWQSIRKYEVDKNGMVRIGDGHAAVPARLLKQLEGTYYTNAVRKLLTSVFSRSVLATHSLTGKPSPAFPNKPAKAKLDPALVSDIIQTVCENCNVEENLVRISITTKCADESKMLRSRESNKKQRRLSKKENRRPRQSTSEDSSE